MCTSLVCRTSVDIRPLQSQPERGTRIGIVYPALASHRAKDIQTSIQVVELYVVRTYVMQFVNLSLRLTTESSSDGTTLFLVLQMTTMFQWAARLCPSSWYASRYTVISSHLARWDSMVYQLHIPYFGNHEPQDLPSTLKVTALHPFAISMSRWRFINTP